MKTLKKNKKPLSKEERAQVMKAGAVWHHGAGGKETPAIWKSVVKGKEWFVCNTHRAMECKPTLKGAIAAFKFIKTTASVLETILADYPIQTHPSKSRPFCLYEDPEAQTEDHCEYVFQAENPDKTFDIYYFWFEEGAALAEAEEVVLNSPTPYKPSNSEVRIEDYDFQDRIGPLPMIRLIFEYADPTGETELES